MLKRGGEVSQRRTGEKIRSAHNLKSGRQFDQISLSMYDFKAFESLGMTMDNAVDPEILDPS